MVVFAAGFAAVVSADGAYVVKATEPRARAPLLPVPKVDTEGADGRHKRRWRGPAHERGPNLLGPKLFISSGIVVEVGFRLCAGLSRARFQR